MAVLGALLSGPIWVVSRNQALKRPLFGTPVCNGVSLGLAAWLPVAGFRAERACGADPAAKRRPIFELAVAVYFGIAASRVSEELDLLAIVLFSIPLLMIFLVDAWTRLIHTNVIGLGILLGWASAATDGPGQLLRSVGAMAAAALVFAGIFFLAVVIYRNPKVVPFGLGDVYLAAMIGSMVRLDDVARALLYGIFLAGITLALGLATRTLNRKQAVPYGPYLVLGCLVVLVL